MEELTTKCDNCGATLETDSKYCAKCGSSIKPNDAVPEPAVQKESKPRGVRPNTGVLVLGLLGCFALASLIPFVATPLLKGTFGEGTTLEYAVLAITFLFGLIISFSVKAFYRRKKPIKATKVSKTERSTSTAPTVFCRSCGQKNEKAHGFCRKCGKKLD